MNIEEECCWKLVEKEYDEELGIEIRIYVWDREKEEKALKKLISTLIFLDVYKDIIDAIYNEIK